MSKAHEDSPVIASSNAFASLGLVVDRAVDRAVVFVAEPVLFASVWAMSEPATGVLLDVLAHAIFVKVFAVVTVGVVEATVATWIGDREGLAAGSRHVADGMERPGAWGV
jgi:membrane-associated protease RseP (regulator of RpoE activity)